MPALRRLPAALLCCAVAAAFTAAPAAAVPDAVVSDCTSHSALTGHYSVAQLRHALATMPADVKEYTACPDIIQRALDAQLSGLHAHGGNAGSGGSFLPGPVIAVLGVLLVAGAAATAVALRRRRGPAAGP